MSFDTIPYDVYPYIGVALPYKDMLQVCTVSKKFATLCNSGEFWKFKAMSDFNISEALFNGIHDEHIAEKVTYIRFAAMINLPIKGAESYKGIDILVDQLATMDEDIDLLLYFYRKNIRRALKSKNVALKKYAAKHGPNSLVKFLDIDPRYNMLILERIGEGVAENGSADQLVDFIDLVTSISVKDRSTCYDGAFKTYIKSNNVKLFDYLVDNTDLYIDVSDAKIAISSNNIKMLQKILPLMDELDNDDYDKLLKAAGKSGNIKIIKYLILLGANNYDAGLLGAADIADLKLVKYFIKLGASEIDRALRYAVTGKKDDVKIFKYFERLGADTEGLLPISARCGKTSIVKYLVQFETDFMAFHKAIIWAILEREHDIVQILISHLVKPDYNKYAKYAAKYGDLDSLIFLLQSGANNIREIITAGTDNLNILCYMYQNYKL